jgi:hypothetical protein
MFLCVNNIFISHNGCMFTWINQIQRRRPELRLIISSATIEARSMSTFFNIRSILIKNFISSWLHVVVFAYNLPSETSTLPIQVVDIRKFFLKNCHGTKLYAISGSRIHGINKHTGISRNLMQCGFVHCLFLLMKKIKVLPW